MNFLFHMLLSGCDDGLLIGNVMGDFVKGPLAGRFPPSITDGVILHRRIDSFAERHQAFRRSRYRLHDRYGLYRGIMVDLFYDHFLILDWHSWNSEPLDAFLARARSVIISRDGLPAEMKRMVPIIFDELLPAYATTEGISRALARFSRRISRANPLADAGSELVRHYEELLQDFRQFTPDAVSFAADTAAGLAGGKESAALSESGQGGCCHA